jgi:hypothetical protein
MTVDGWRYAETRFFQRRAFRRSGFYNDPRVAQLEWSGILRHSNA